MPDEMVTVTALLLSDTPNTHWSDRAAQSLIGQVVSPVEGTVIDAWYEKGRGVVARLKVPRSAIPGEILPGEFSFGDG